MAAIVVAVPPEDWPTVEKYMLLIEDGGILVGPDAAAAFERRHGKPVPHETRIVYDFGGQPDKYVDMIYSPDGLDSMAGEAIVKHVTGHAPDPEEDE